METHSRGGEALFWWGAFMRLPPRRCYNQRTHTEDAAALPCPKSYFKSLRVSATAS